MLLCLTEVDARKIKWSQIRQGNYYTVHFLNEVSYSEKPQIMLPFTTLQCLGYYNHITNRTKHEMLQNKVKKTFLTTLCSSVEATRWNACNECGNSRGAIGSQGPCFGDFIVIRICQLEQVQKFFCINRIEGNLINTSVLLSCSSIYHE